MVSNFFFGQNLSPHWHYLRCRHPPCPENQYMSLNFPSWRIGFTPPQLSDSPKLTAPMRMCLPSSPSRLRGPPLSPVQASWSSVQAQSWLGRIPGQCWVSLHSWFEITSTVVSCNAMAPEVFVFPMSPHPNTHAVEPAKVEFLCGRQIGV